MNKKITIIKIKEYVWRGLIGLGLKFETNRLILRPFELSDAKTVQMLAGNQEIASTTLNIPYPYPDGAAEKWIERTLQSEEGNHYVFALVKKENGELIGSMALSVNMTHDHAELAYWVGRPFWGQGFATEAAHRLVQFGFGDLGLNRIFARAFSRNPASYKVMTKIGMKYEGTLPQHVIKWDNYEDLELYGMLRSEYTMV